MHRFFILFGYTSFILYLHITGKLSNYINLKYSFISIIAIIFLIILLVVELYRVIEKSVLKKKGKMEENYDCGHEHGDHFDEQTEFTENGTEVLTRRQEMTYWLFFIPIIVGFLFPVGILDSSIVDTKGFHFPFSKQEAGDFKSQFLRPNSSFYFSEDYYKEMNTKRMTELKKEKIVHLDDVHYLKDMEVLYNNIDESKGKDVEFDGFVFNDPNSNKQYVFILRFGIIHCIADSGIYGFLTELPTGAHFSNDTWLHIKGNIDEIYYPTVKGKVPLVKANNVKEIKAPKSPYVYMKY
jgi:putative membrane protein